MRTKETTPTLRGRVEAVQRAGTRLARLFFYFLTLSNGQQRQFLIKFCYLPSHVVLFCNPTIQVTR